MTEDDAKDLGWRCRRGTRELETLLGSFLSRDYGSLNPVERNTFRTLLEREDDELAAYFFAKDPVVPPQLMSLVDKVRRSFSS